MKSSSRKRWVFGCCYTLSITLNSLITASSEASIPNVSTLEAARFHELRGIFLRGFDHDRDSKVTYREAAFGLRSLAEDTVPPPPPLSFSFEGSEKRVDAALDHALEKQTLRMCKHELLRSTDDAAFLLDCAADMARRALQRGASTPGAELSLDDALAWYASERSPLQPNGAVAHCEDIVERSPKQCAELVRAGFCHLSCHVSPHAARSQTPLEQGRGPHTADDVFSSVREEKETTGPRIAEKGQGKKRHTAVERKSKSEPTVIPLFVSSDWHIEPWYDTSNNMGAEAGGDARVSRYATSTPKFRYACFNQTIGAAQLDPMPCTVTNVNDPPLPLVVSHLDWVLPPAVGALGRGATGGAHSGAVLAEGGSDHRGWKSVRKTDAEDTLLLILGDLQAHDESQLYMKQDWIENVYETASTALSQVLFGTTTNGNTTTGRGVRNPSPASVTTDVILPGQGRRLGGPDHLAICAGNNDGPHGLIFVRSGAQNAAASVAWARPVLATGIVTDELGRVYEVPRGSKNVSSGKAHGQEMVTMSQTEFFNSTGYYLKELTLPSKAGSVRLFAMAFNTNLGTDNDAQNSAIESDLAWLQGLAATATAASSIDESIGLLVLGHHPSVMSSGIESPHLANYAELVLGTFAGHTHIADDTNAVTRYTQVGAVSQGGTTDNGFFAASLKIPASTNSRISSRSSSSEEANGKFQASSPSPLSFEPFLLTRNDNWVRWNGTAGQQPNSESWRCCG